MGTSSLLAHINYHLVKLDYILVRPNFACLRAERVDGSLGLGRTGSHDL